MRDDLPSVIKIGNKAIGAGQPTFFIAEIGNNHNGDYFMAKRSIEEAAQAGADAVKFQKRFIDEVFTKELQDTPQTKDEVFGKTYGEYRKSFELSKEDFIKLKKVSEDLGVIFFATPFDLKGVEFLEEIGMDLYKIASFDATNIPLLEAIAKKGKPIILSVGMSTAEETDLAVETILKHNKNLILMHCVSVYPTPDERLNLSTISYLKEKYAPLPVGYSGHERDILPSISSVTLGGCVIERHFTLDKKLPGPDHGTISIEPEEFKQMVEGARRIEKALGVTDKILFEEEKKVRAKHSKSIVSKKSIKAGTVITEDLLAFKSPGHGFKPYELDKVVGKKVVVDIPEDAVITAEHIS